MAECIRIICSISSFPYICLQICFIVFNVQVNSSVELQPLSTVEVEVVQCAISGNPLKIKALVESRPPVSEKGSVCKSVNVIKSSLPVAKALPAKKLLCIKLWNASSCAC